MRISYTIKDQAYDILRKSIISGKYAMGQQLKEVQISEELGISRSPVRTAFTRLANDGLLEEKANRGVFVHQATEKHVDDIIGVRILLEREAILSGKNSPKYNKDRLLEFRREFDQYFRANDQEAYSTTDFNFHSEIMNYYDNALAIDFYQRIYAVIQMYRNIALKSQDRFELSYNEHLDIIDALLEEDFKKAWNINHYHLIETGKEIKSVI